MNKLTTFALIALLLAPLAALHAAELALPGKSPEAIYDLVGYGDSSGAVIAAIAAVSAGRLSESRWAASRTTPSRSSGRASR